MGCTVTRRGFLGGAGAIAGCTLGPGGLIEAREFLDGRSPFTKEDWAGLMRHMGTVPMFNCVRTLETDEGPFYYERSPERRDLTGKRRGLPLKLGITVAGVGQGTNCFALSGAVVDVWQTDGTGMYSNVGPDLQSEDTRGGTFLRGHQVTDQNGYVEFDSLVPGWELVVLPVPDGTVLPPGVDPVAFRTNHIHVKVFHERKVVTTQFYLPEDFLDLLYRDVEPYRSHRLMRAPGIERDFERVRNAQDFIYIQDQAQPLQIEHRGNAVLAMATIGIAGTMGNRGLQPLWR